MIKTILSVSFPKRTFPGPSRGPVRCICCLQSSGDLVGMTLLDCFFCFYNFLLHWDHKIKIDKTLKVHYVTTSVYLPKSICEFMCYNQCIMTSMNDLIDSFSDLFKHMTGRGSFMLNAEDRYAA